MDMLGSDASLLVRRVLVFCAVALAATQSALGSVIVTNNRSAIGPGYTVDWGDLGGDLTPVASPFTLGPVTVAGASEFTVFSGATYNADFAPGDFVLSLYDIANFNPLPGVFSITFTTPVLAAGAQVQANAFGSFSGTISAFDAFNAPLGSFAVNGSNGGNGDDSAVFAGIISSAADIARIEYASFGDGAAINRLSVATGGASVPEPPMWSLLVAAMLLMSAFARRRV